jgi:hypothetical protein
VIQARAIARRQRSIMAIEAALVAAAIWRIGPGLAAVRIAPMLLFWACAFAIQLFVFIAISWDDFLDVLLASLTGSAAAMWFAPAIILLSLRSHPAMETGLLLVAGATTLLVSRNAPQKLAPQPPSPSPSHRMFRDIAPPDVPFSKQMLVPFAGALAVQLSVCAIWAGQPLVAAILMACGAGFWTWSSMTRGAIRRRNATRPSHWLLSILVTLLLTTLLSMAQTSGDPGVREMMSRIWHQLVNSEAPRQALAPQQAHPRDQRIASDPGKAISAGGSSLAPGVILIPLRKQPFVLLIPPAARKHPTVTQIQKPLTFPFTGEYRLFPASSARVKHSWATENGTPLESLYATTGGGALDTEAWQTLNPPIDFSNCGKVLLEIVHAEDGPFGASMKLSTARGSTDLGYAVAGLDRRPKETLEFIVPPQPAGLHTQAIRVNFRRIPEQGPQSMKVDIQQFTMVPR